MICETSFRNYAGEWIENRSGPALRNTLVVLLNVACRFYTGFRSREIADTSVKQEDVWLIYTRLHLKAPHTVIPVPTVKGAVSLLSIKNAKQLQSTANSLQAIRVYFRSLASLRVGTHACVSSQSLSLLTKKNACRADVLYFHFMRNPSSWLHVPLLEIKHLAVSQHSILWFCFLCPVSRCSKLSFNKMLQPAQMDTLYIPLILQVAVLATSRRQ